MGEARNAVRIHPPQTGLDQGTCYGFGVVGRDPHRFQTLDGPGQHAVTMDKSRRRHSRIIHACPTGYLDECYLLA